MGRFLTRDTWGGNANVPMSFNRWNYVGGNPVNLTDPSGQFPPIWCQAMPNKATYEGCVDLWYGIEPINPFQLGENVLGDRGCYVGPIHYRAPGYVEGTGLTVALPWIVNWMFAVESVYDFATMEHNYFVNGAFNTLGVPGVGESDFIWGLNLTEYVGTVKGFASNSDIKNDYGGAFIMGYIGISGPPGPDQMGPSVGIGRTAFISPTNPMIRGSSLYVSAGFGVDILPVMDLGFGIISTIPPRNEPNIYKYRGLNLFLDILTGKHNVWISDFGPRSLRNATNGSRMIAALKSLRYLAAWEEIPHVDQ